LDDHKVEADYSEYLGPQWREELKERTKPIPTIVANHSSIMDIFVMLGHKLCPSFVAASFIKKTYYGKQCTGLESLYINRPNKKKAQEDPSYKKKYGEEVINKIMNRQ
jgi:hypothetical protein